MVMVTECHFQIETNEFREMSVSVGVLSAEHYREQRTSAEQSREQYNGELTGSDGVHLAEIGSNRHLLVELRRLREEGVRFEVCHLKHVRTSFRRR